MNRQYMEKISACQSSWHKEMHKLLDQERRTPWEIGDLYIRNVDPLKHGTKKQALTELVEEFGKENVRSIETYASLCRKFPADQRDMRVNFSIHRAMCGLPVEKRKKLLKDAAENRWTLQEVRQRVKQKTGLEKTVGSSLARISNLCNSSPPGKCDVVAADRENLFIPPEVIASVNRALRRRVSEEDIIQTLDALPAPTFPVIDVVSSSMGQ